MMSACHITKMKVVTILVDFKARVKVVLKEMRQLIESTDLLVGLDQAMFADLPSGDFTDPPAQSHPTPPSTP